MTKYKPKGGGGYKKTASSRPRTKSAVSHVACSKKRSIIKDRLRALQNEVTHLQGELSTLRAIVEDVSQHTDLLLRSTKLTGGKKV